MAIYIKNKALKKRVFKQMDKFDKKALAYYKKGNMAEGKYWENQSDELYRLNYPYIFGQK